MRLRPGVPPGWPWELAFAQRLVSWAVGLRWQDGPGDVTLAQLALDCKAFVGRALLASPNLQMQGPVLQLQRHVRPGREERPRPRPATMWRCNSRHAYRRNCASSASGRRIARTACARRPESGQGGAARFLMTYFLRPPGLHCFPMLAGRSGSTPRGLQKSNARGGRGRAEGCWAPGVRHTARLCAAAACSWARESANAAARGTRAQGAWTAPPAPSAATGHRPAGASTGGLPGGSKPALGIAGAG